MGIKKQRLLLYIATCFMWFSLYVYVPILSPYAKSMGASYTLVGAILSSYGLIQLCMRIPFGVLSDVLSKRKLFLYFGSAMGGISSLGMFLSPGPQLLLIFRACAGLSASTWAIYMIAYNSYYDREQQPRAIGLVNSALYLGQCIATLLGGLIAQYIGERATFAVAASAAIIGLLVLLRLPEPHAPKREPIKFQNFLALFQNKNLLLYSVMGIIMQAALYTGAFGFVSNILRDMGANNFLLGLATTLSTIPAILSSSLSGTFFKKTLGQKKTVLIGFALLSFTLLAVAAADTVMVIMLLMLVSGFSKGMLQPVLTSLAIADAKDNLRSTAASFFQSVYGIGMTLGPIVSGAIADHFSMAAAFVAMGAVTMLGFVFVLIKKENQAQP